MKTMLFNPYTGTPRHPSDIASDPEGILIMDPEATTLEAYKAPAAQQERRPDWHDAPTVEGIWLQKLEYSEQTVFIGAHELDRPCWRGRWYGPMPEDAP